MCTYVTIVAFLIYVFVAQNAVLSTWGHFKEADHIFRPLDVLRSQVYTQAGNRLRIRAILTIVIGAIVFVAISIGCFFVLAGLSETT